MCVFWFNKYPIITHNGVQAKFGINRDETGYSACYTIHCKKRFAIFPSPAGMSLTKLSLGRNTVFPSRESLVSDIPAGDGKIMKLFYSVLSVVHHNPTCYENAKKNGR